MIKIVRNPKRVGAATSRVNGWRASTGQVAVFFDSQMEVNIDWYVSSFTITVVNSHM